MTRIDHVRLKVKLDDLVDEFEQASFIKGDPISIPHRYQKRQDVEIAGLFAAIFAWGQRKTIIAKAADFLSRMDNDPHDFILNFKPVDLKAFESFRHRTFQPDDAYSFLYFLQDLYREFESLEAVFLPWEPRQRIVEGFNELSRRLASHPAVMRRSLKHLSCPARGSACKRLNMFLRWMVRSDERGVDFGLWKELEPAELVVPLDLHVFRTARYLGLTKSTTSNWNTALDLTAELRCFDPEDPVKYDFALFNLSLKQKSHPIDW